MNIKAAIDRAMKGDVTGFVKSLSSQVDYSGLASQLGGDGLPYLPGISYLAPVDSATYRGGSDGSDNPFTYFMGGKKSRGFKYLGPGSCIDAYIKCPPISAVIDRKAQAYINGNTWILNSQGKESQTPDAKKLRKLFTNPNPLQSWRQFEAQGYIYQQLFGFTIVLPIKPFGFKDNIDATSLWNIPPSMIDIEETNKLFYQTDTQGVIKQIVLNYKGTRTLVNIADIMIMKDFKPSFDSLIIPESRVRSVELPVSNIIGAYESRGVLINYRGALGILSHDPGNSQYAPIAISPDDKKQLQIDFRRYGLREQQWQFIVTSAALKWQQMGVPTKDLMLIEEVDSSIQAICDEFNYPYQLMSTAKGTTFSNVKEGKQLLYQDAIIPESKSIYEQWNQFFGTSEMNITIDKDYSHIPALQEDEVSKMNARKVRDDAMKIEWDNGLITLNQWRVANGEDPVIGGDLYIGEMAKESDAPLATAIGVGGVQGIIAILTAQGLSSEAKRNTLEVVFGIPSADAARMVVDDPNASTTAPATTPPPAA